ncbi:ornithine cyclodeaminase family protein [Promicromonospora sukumoe]
MSTGRLNWPTPAVFTEDDVRAAVGMPEAIASARQALLALADGRARSPEPWHLDMAEGSVHVKGGALDGAATFATKLSSGFPGNAGRGLPTSDGFTAILDAATGQVRALLLDGGYLTELRTGAAGAVALDLLAAPRTETIAFVGTGGQIRHQITGALHVREPAAVILLGRRRAALESLAKWVRSGHDVDVRIQALNGSPIDADAVVTATTATSPILFPGQLRPGVHVTAVGSDSPGKRELDPAILLAADLVAVDERRQSMRIGELQGIPPNGLAIASITTLGALLRDGAPAWSPRRTSVADLSGTGAQDAAIAETAADRLLA